MEITTNQVNNYMIGSYSRETINKVLDVVQVVNRLQLWSWLKTYEPEMGYTYSQDPHIYEIYGELLLVDDSHSGASFGITMRLVKDLCRVFEEVRYH